MDEVDGLMDAVMKQSGNMPVVGNARKLRTRMEQEVHIMAELKEQADSIDPDQIEKALAKAAGLGVTKGGDVEKLKKRVVLLQVQYPLTLAMQAAIKNKDEPQLKKCMEEIKKL